MRSILAWIVVACVHVAGCGMSTTGEDAGTDAPVAACRHASDCPDGFVCIGNACQARVPCTTSRMCPGVLCNATIGACAECVAPSDCSGGARCSSGVCEPAVACRSDRDCTSMDEVCDALAMLCVECNADADCVAPRTCAVDHACVVPTCSGDCDAGIGDAGAGDAGDVDSGSADMDAGLADGGNDGGVDARMDAGDDALVDACCGSGSDASNDAGVDANSDAGPAWEVLGVTGGLAAPGYSDFTPASGAGAFYASSSDTTPSFALYEPVGTGRWTSEPSATSALGRPAYFSGPAWVGNALYLDAVGSVYRFDIATATWSTLLTGVATTYWAQNTADDSGHVYVVTADGRVASYDIATNTVTYQAVGMSPPMSCPRLAWDSPSHLLYVVPNMAMPMMYSFDPATGAVAPLAPLSERYFNPMFCGDRNGHIYAAGDTVGTTLWQYDVPTNSWSTPLPTLPFDHDANGACTVTADGYLYVTANGSQLARLRVH